jgi:hypothetical protein
VSQTNSQRGRAKRAARWTYEEAGEVYVFTKAQVRARFPSVEPIDRRARHLRKVGRLSDTYREDRKLSHEQLRSRRIAAGGHLVAARVDQEPLRRIRQVPGLEMGKLLDWAKQGHGKSSPAEVLWAAHLRQLPRAQRDRFIASLTERKGWNGC